MKKIITLAIAIMTIGLVACAQKKGDKMEKQEKTLVAYFSATGTTERAAKNLAKACGADLFKIEPTKPYTSADLDWTNKQSRSTIEMQDKKSRPAIADTLDDITQYNTIYVGFPIWWYTAPTIINTFLESYNLEGKTIILFATSGGSNLNNCAKDLSPSAPKAIIKNGFMLNGNPSVEEIKKKL